MATKSFWNIFHRWKHDELLWMVLQSKIKNIFLGAFLILMQFYRCLIEKNFDFFMSLFFKPIVDWSTWNFKKIEELFPVLLQLWVDCRNITVLSLRYVRILWELYESRMRAKSVVVYLAVKGYRNSLNRATYNSNVYVALWNDYSVSSSNYIKSRQWWNGSTINRKQFQFGRARKKTEQKYLLPKLLHSKEKLSTWSSSQVVKGTLKLNKLKDLIYLLWLNRKWTRKF